MKLNKLGKTNIYISEIGFGAWGIGGLTPGNSSYGHTDDKTSMAALNCAFDEGINFFDTSNVYGNGHSETIIGQVFKKKRSEVIIATKCGMINMTGEQDFSIPSLNKSIEDSLKRLDTDFIDLLQFHDAPVSLASNELIAEEVLRLKSRGIIRAAGVTVKKPEDGLYFLSSYWDSIQCNLNLIDQRAIDCGLLKKAIESNISIISRTPLAFGFLTGKYMNKPVMLPTGDHRLRWPTHQLRIWADAPSLFERILEKNQRSMLELALKFCSSFHAVASTIPGMLSPHEVNSNIITYRSPALNQAELEEIFLIYKNNSFFG